MDCEAVETISANRCLALGVPVYEIFANLACNKIGIPQGRSPKHGPCGGETALEFSDDLGPERAVTFRHRRPSYIS
jgi:hypothetical protein